MRFSPPSSESSPTSTELRKALLPPKPNPLQGANATPRSDARAEGAAGTKGLPKLHGDLRGLENVFVETRRKLVGTTVPESVYLLMQQHPGGISGFFEDAVLAFNGDLPTLVESSVRFVRARKLRASSDPIRNANGRVFPETYARIREVECALSSVKGMSRAKVLSGLICIFIEFR